MAKRRRLAEPASAGEASVLGSVTSDTGRLVWSFLGVKDWVVIARTSQVFLQMFRAGLSPTLWFRELQVLREEQRPMWVADVVRSLRQDEKRCMETCQAANMRIANIGYIICANPACYRAYSAVPLLPDTTEGSPSEGDCQKQCRACIASAHAAKADERIAHERPHKLRATTLIALRSLRHA